ncbi:MAG: OmpA family protein [Pseudomonadota bacterium]
MLSQQPIRFAPGTADIDHTAFSTLDSVIEEAAQCASASLRIEGHTDSLGSESRNLQLSQARADAVADYLSAHGIQSARITTIGVGSAQPIADNASRDGRRANRRVVIRFVAESGRRD